MLQASNADFVSNFDLVTEQDLLNVHSSTKFVIERAKSELINNVVKSLKAKKEKSIEQQNEATRRFSRTNSYKPPIDKIKKDNKDKNDVTQIINDTITNIKDIELVVQHSKDDNVIEDKI